MKYKVKVKKSIPTCPVGCKYCMAQKIDTRASYWKDISRIGMNKSCVFFNRLPQDPPIEDMNYPWNLLDGEYLGFQVITDCFWDVFKDDLKFIVKKINESNIRKLCLISKIPLSDEQLKILLPIKNKLVICYSVTGLDELENIKTKDRIDALVKIKANGIDTLPVMHPYIHGYTNVEYIFKLLNKNGFENINWKGFRYNPNNMKDLLKYISNDVLRQYENDEKEVLIGEDYLKELSNKYSLKFWDLKEYLHRNPVDNMHLNVQVIKKQVEELAKMCVFSTSSSKEDVIKSCISRRCIL